MATIKLQKEAIPIIKSGLVIEENLLKIRLDEYEKDLDTLEKKYKMSREEFNIENFDLPLILLHSINTFLPNSAILEVFQNPLYFNHLYLNP